MEFAVDIDLKVLIKAGFKDVRPIVPSLVWKNAAVIYRELILVLNATMEGFIKVNFEVLVILAV